jgi:hypothetical protein
VVIDSNKASVTNIAAVLKAPVLDPLRLMNILPACGVALEV